MQRGFRYGATLAVVLGAALGSAAAPPDLKLPAELTPERGFVTYTPPADVKSIHYLIDGLTAFPAPLLRDERSLVIPTKGEAAGRYRLIVSAANAQGELTVVDTAVVIGVPPPRPKDPDPNPKPKDPAPPARGFYFLIVRPDGPAAPEVTRALGLPAWAALAKQGHQYKDKTQSAAAADLGLTLPAGTPLPCVVTLTVADGVSRVARGPVPLPTTDAGVAALPEGVK